MHVHSAVLFHKQNVKGELELLRTDICTQKGGQAPLSVTPVTQTASWYWLAVLNPICAGSNVHFRMISALSVKGDIDAGPRIFCQA